MSEQGEVEETNVGVNEQDYANAAYRLERLITAGFMVLIINAESEVLACCRSHKVLDGRGDTLAEALISLEKNLTFAGFYNGTIH